MNLTVVEFYIARIDNFRREDESVEAHTKRMSALMDEQFKDVDATKAESSYEPGNAEEFPDWLVELLADTAIKPMSLWRRFLATLGVIRIPNIEDRLKYDPINRCYKIFFDSVEESKRAVGWRTRSHPDTPGEFQKRFNAMVTEDDAAKAWAAQHRLQITGLTEINFDVLETDEDLAEYSRSSAYK